MIRKERKITDIRFQIEAELRGFGATPEGEGWANLASPGVDGVDPVTSPAEKPT